jgi:hypothetical protein
LAAMENGRAVDAVPSLAFAAEDGTLTLNPPAPVMENLDSLPFAARDLGAALALRGLPLNIQGSRGCCGSCSYCPSPGFPRARAGMGWRGRAPEAIAEEMEAAVRETGIRHFNFVDDDFLGPEPASRQRARAFSRSIRLRSLRIAFAIQARPSSLSPESLEALAGAGLCRVFLGVENDDAGVLRKWGRKPGLRSAWSAVETARRLGVDAQIGCILFHPEAGFNSVRRFALLLSRMGLLDYRAAVSRLQCFPGSRMHREYGAGGPSAQSRAGAFTPPIGDPCVQEFHRILESVLEPLRPAWVHAACRLPGRIAAVRLASEKEYADARRGLDGLRGVLSELDSTVGRVFFSLLEDYTLGKQTAERIGELRSATFRAGESAALGLSELNEVESSDVLRQAIRPDGRP